jgi:hypothetical protein
MKLDRCFVRYDPLANCLVVLRSGEVIERKIPCLNVSRVLHKVYGVEICGDAVDLLVGLRGSSRPDRRVRYYFSSLRGGASIPI